MFQFSDRIAQKIEMLFPDYEIGVIMGQKAKNAGKTKKQDKGRCASCNCKYKDDDTCNNMFENGAWICDNCNINMMMKHLELWVQQQGGFENVEDGKEYVGYSLDGKFKHTGVFKSCR